MAVGTINLNEQLDQVIKAPTFSINHFNLVMTLTRPRSSLLFFFFHGTFLFLSRIRWLYSRANDAVMCLMYDAIHCVGKNERGLEFPKSAVWAAVVPVSLDTTPDDCERVLADQPGGSTDTDDIDQAYEELTAATSPRSVPVPHQSPIPRDMELKGVQLQSRFHSCARVTQ